MLTKLVAKEQQLLCSMTVAIFNPLRFNLDQSAWVRQFEGTTPDSLEARQAVNLIN